MEKTKAPGVGVAISIGGDIAYFKGFGVADVEKNCPVTEDTVFGLGSVTKSFTALAVNLLAEKGALSLWHPVKRYLPEFKLPSPGHEEKITIHNFLTHTSGIPPLPCLRLVNEASVPLEEPAEAPRPGVAEEAPYGAEAPQAGETTRPRMWTNRDLLAFIAEHPFKMFPGPGQHVSYSNDCYSLLGEIIERVSGVSYESYLAEYLWKPLGMTNTFVDVRRVLEFERVQGLYDKDRDGRVFKVPWRHREAFVSSGSVKSSVRDLVKYLTVYLNQGGPGGVRICEGATVDRMITPYYRLEDGSYYSYGFLVYPAYTGDATLVCHGGNVTGVACYIGLVPEKKMSVVVLSNLTGFPARKVFFAAVNLSFGLPLDHQEPKLPAVELPRAQLEKFVGRYASGEGVELSFGLEGNELVATLTSDQKTRVYPARPTGPDSVTMTRDDEDVPVFFMFDPRGSVWAIRYGLRLIPRVEAGTEVAQR